MDHLAQPCRFAWRKADRPTMKIAAVVLAILLVLIVVSAALLYTPDKSRAALEAAYGAAPSDFLTVAGLRLHLRDTGPRDAPVVIMLHGFGSSLQTWDGWAEGLKAKYRVIRFDLPGFGLTGADPTGDYTDARTVAVLATLMDTLSIRRASLIGNSLGGKIAWNFAAAYPDRVAKLVLVSPDGFASPGFDYNKKAEVPVMMQALPYVLPSAMLRANLASAFADKRAMTDTLFRRYRDMMLAPGVRRAMLNRMSQVMLVPPEATLRRIQAPTLLVWGERDAMIPFSNSADYLKAIPHVSLAPFPNLGHVPQEEAPAQSLVPVETFLAG
jgi:pimeloyl-ACP methyl ester carboxylesterase